MVHLPVRTNFYFSKIFLQSESVDNTFQLPCFAWLYCRYDSEDCSAEEELPDFAPLSDYHLVPELQLK